MVRSAAIERIEAPTRGGKAMAEEEKEEKKGGKVRKFFLFAAFAAIVAGAVKFFRGRRSGFEEDEWRELPPPAESG
jgi:hypothetical protein